MKMRDCLILFVVTLVSGAPVDLEPFETTTPARCFDNGRWYGPGENITDGQTGNLCYWSFCNHSGHIITVPNSNCNTTVTAETTTPSHFQTSRVDCPYNGSCYRPGEVIRRGQDGDLCYTMICGASGEKIVKDNFKCQTSPPSGCLKDGQWYGLDSNCNTTVTAETTTPSHFQTNVSCHYNGSCYRPGEVIRRGQDGDLCYTMICGASGEKIVKDNFKCQTSPPSVCLKDGQWYGLGEEISQNQTDTYCFRTICDHSGNVTKVDDWKCKTTMAPASTPDVDNTNEQ